LTKRREGGHRWQRNEEGMAEIKTASNYQPARDNEDGEPIGKILVHCMYGQVRTKSEPNFLNGFPTEIPIDPLIWGGIYAASYPALQEARHRQVEWILVLFTYFHGGTVLEDLIGLEWINRIVFGLFMTEFILFMYFSNRLAQRMRIAMADLNLTLAKLGFRVSYEVECTGHCYTEEHRIYIYALQPQALSSTEILQRLPPCGVAQPAEPVTVYLYASTFQQIVWRLTCSRPDCFIDGQPPALIYLNSFLWGALHYAVRVDELEAVQRKYVSATFLIMFVIPFFLITGNPDVAWLSIMIPLVIFYMGYVIFLECFLASRSRNGAHATWTQVVHQWQDVFGQAGWQLEYHHNGDVQTACAPSSNVFIRFVPSRPV
jgi:hypothetical protein